ncbi:hypothetical protein [Aliiroseovarius sp. 2305UL8-7]|uniref:hypothetical protein n=1 Tax=Aliiroseovarius conchicola TaxID=3121637 RepID=UPI003527B480
MADAQDRSGRWPVWLLALVLYPFAAGAAAVNLFFLTLMTQAIGLNALSPVQSIVGGVALGVPFAWVAGKWMRGLIDKAEDEA